jgi:hypothetical protein
MAMAEAVMAASLDRLQQLFNSFDPSSFPERDLDYDAEEYIVRWAEHIALPRPRRLIIHLPPTKRQKLISLRSNGHNYFAHQQQAEPTRFPFATEVLRC